MKVVSHDATAKSRHDLDREVDDLRRSINARRTHGILYYLLLVAIILIGFEFPNWCVRRLVCEDGEWLCSLSRQPNLSIFLDELAEGSHAVLALAVLRAFVAARCRSAATQQVAAPVPLALPRPAYVFCCDNLA